MKSKILLTFFVSMFTWVHIVAQVHDNSRGACKLFKNKAIEEGASCPACVAKDKKEQAARDVVNKKRQDVLTAKANAERLAKEAAYKKEMAERKANEKVTEVKVVMPKSSVVKNEKPVKKAKIENTDKTILISKRYGFQNEKDEVLFENYDWDATYTIQDLSITKNAVRNFGIVDIKSKGKANKFGEFRADVVNSKGEYLFNDENIKFICHINDGWLLIGSYNSNDYYVYNLLTKERIGFSSISQYGSEFGSFVWGPAIDYFLPIFSDNVELYDNGTSYQLQNKFKQSAYLKKKLATLFPAQINEAFLSKQSFVLVHTNTSTTYIAENFELNYNGTDSIIIYCISKDGKLDTIKLK